MVRVTKARDVISGSKMYLEYAGLSDDDKPVEDNISTGSLFLEVNTGDVYAYDEDGATWHQICSLGGGS